MSKNIQYLREKLFETLDLVKSGEMNIEQSKMISEISQTIINSAKVEVSYIQAAGSVGQSQFLEPTIEPLNLNGPDSLAPMGRVVHRMRS
jgi:polyhydroxyalkanoate synthesis regulator phasin